LLEATLGPQAPGWFEVIGAGDIVAAKKPAPDIYHWVLQQLRLPAADCLALEDSAAGACAANAAGLATVVTRSTYTLHDTMPPLLADLPQLGEPGQPCQGVVGGRPWQGWVDTDALKAWLPRQ
jgi:beta-phosphoglucomutase-like phosphatase (HAD superfamily)